MREGERERMLKVYTTGGNFASLFPGHQFQSKLPNTPGDRKKTS